MRVMFVVPTSRRIAPRDGHDLRDAEAAADLDELAARDDHFLPRGQGAQDDHRGRGAVVDGRRRLAAE